MLAGIGRVAESSGLIIITLERYFKIVHTVLHRKYNRDWMTKLLVALPWIGGICMIVFPATATSRVVNGHCLRYGVWPNEAMKQVIRNKTVVFQITSDKCFILTYLKK